MERNKSIVYIDREIDKLNFYGYEFIPHGYYRKNNSGAWGYMEIYCIYKNNEMRDTTMKIIFH